MVTRLVALLAVLHLAAFVWFWPPGGFLLVGLFLLLLTLIRNENEKVAKRAAQRNP